jgi:putative phosphoribosyl transferase
VAEVNHLSERRFRDRHDAGRGLGDELRALNLGPTQVLALPRGGVPVGVEVAAVLAAPLDVLVARKVSLPGQPEYAIGAVAEGTRHVVMRTAASGLGLSDDEIEAAVDRARREVDRRVVRYRGERPLPDLHGRVAVIVDDGLATGATAEAALHAALEGGASDIVLAVPVGAAQTVARLESEVRVVCLSMPERFTAVGLWYDDFEQVTDEDVFAAIESRG